MSEEGAPNPPENYPKPITPEAQAIGAKQPADACCLTCRYHVWHSEQVGKGVCFFPCWKHRWEGTLKPGNLESATRDAGQYCCTLWSRSWWSRVERIKSWLRK